MRSVLVLVLISTTAAADPVDHARASIYLAQHGQCDSAMQYAQMVYDDDPGTYQRMLANQPDIATCMAQGYRVGQAQVAPTPVMEPGAQYIHQGAPKCRSYVYGEPSLFVGGKDRQLLHRIAVGGIFRNCTSDGVDLTNARLGLTLAISDDDYLHNNAALGIEAELDHPIAEKLRLGGRVGYESNGSSLFTFGARLHYDDMMFVGIDWFYASNNYHYYPEPYGYGLMVGGGFEGKAGGVVAAGEGILTVGLFLLVIAACSSGGCFGD